MVLIYRDYGLAYPWPRAYSTDKPDARHRLSLRDERYAVGFEPPHYPVPAIPIRVGYQPEHWSQIAPSAYWYVASRELLWSFFKEGFNKRWGIAIERK